MAFERNARQLYNKKLKYIDPAVYATIAQGPLVPEEEQNDPDVNIGGPVDSVPPKDKQSMGQQLGSSSMAAQHLGNRGNRPVGNGQVQDVANQILGNMANTVGDAVPEGMNYMEEQHIKYGNDLGNYKPQPIIGTQQMSSVYKNNETMTPEEYSYFFNWQHPLIPGGKVFARNKPSGTSNLYDETHLHYNILAEKDKKFEFSKVHGGLIQNRTRFDEAPVFLSSY